jgi:hypothetical protein
MEKEENRRNARFYAPRKLFIYKLNSKFNGMKLMCGIEDVHLAKGFPLKKWIYHEKLSHKDSDNEIIATEETLGT